jgi:hypothetical protein
MKKILITSLILVLLAAAAFAQDEAPVPVAQDEAPVPVAEDEASVPVAQDEAPVPVAQDEAPVPVAEDEAPVPVAQDEAPVAARQEEKPFSLKIDIDVDLFSFVHTDIKNDEYVSPEEKIEEDLTYFMNGSDYGDTSIEFKYTDPADRFGGVIGIDFDGTLTNTFPLGDLYGWGRVTKYARFQLGKFTYRTIEKIGGDKDLGVLLFNIDKDGDLAFDTTDSFGLGDDTIGFLASGYIGPAALNVFVTPDAYHVARTYKVPGSSGGTEPNKVPAYYSYKAGGSLRFDFPGLVSVAASFRQEHTTGDTYTVLGYISNDYGLYADITALSAFGLEIGVGYSGRVAFEDLYFQEGEEERDALDFAPVMHAIHLDLKYTGVPKLTVGLYNNISFYSLAADKTLVYDKDIAAVADVYTDEKVFVLYNELTASYNITETFFPSLKLRNYYGSISGRNGTKDQDYGKDVLTIEALANYNITKEVSLRTGLKFINAVYNTPETSYVLKNDTFVFAIPIGITVQW